MTARRFEGAGGAEACERFERLVDEGVGRDVPDAWRAHVAACDRCARAVAGALAIDALLAELDAPAPAGFADSVMRRVAESPRPAWTWTPAIEDPMPWWVRVAAQPSTVLAAGVAALAAWKGTPLLGAARAALAAVDAWTSTGWAAVGATPIGGAVALAGSAAAGTAAAFGALVTALAEAFGRAWGAAGPAQAAVLVGVLPVLLWVSAELMRWAEGVAAPRRDPTLH